MNICMAHFEFCCENISKISEIYSLFFITVLDFGLFKCLWGVDLFSFFGDKWNRVPML